MEPPSQLKVSILNRSQRIAPSAKIRKAIQCALGQFQINEGAVSVLITTDEEQKALNLNFRGIPTTTDVLTFPAAPNFPGQKPVPLGDISISYDQAVFQAQLRKVPARDEIVMLAIHGALHLAGLDDETESQRAEMLDVMNQIAVQVCIPTDANWSSQVKKREAVR